MTVSSTPLELWQTEWCPASQRVRRRLTELGLSYTVHQVPARAEERDRLTQRTGETAIPVLVAGGEVVAGEAAIVRRPPHRALPRAARRAPAAGHGGNGQPQATGAGMPTTDHTYSLTTTTELGFADAVGRVREELAADGFGVLCEIDVQATLKAKLGVDREPDLILGACNPTLAHQALEAEPELGVLLPCNVIVYSQDGETHIAAVDAGRMLSIIGNAELTPVAAQVRSRLGAIIERAAGA